MRFAIPLLAALAMTTLVACGGGDDDETAVPVPPAQRFVTEEDAPGSKPDPVEGRQTTMSLGEFIAGLHERRSIPTKKRRPRSFRGWLQGVGCGRTFLRDTHTDTAPHVFSSFMELGSEDGATSVLDWLAGPRRPPTSQRPRTSSGSESKAKCPPTATGWYSATVHSFTPWICTGRRGLYPRSRLWTSQARTTTGLRAVSTGPDVLAGT